MTTVAARTRDTAPTDSVWPLARVEALRYARHPLFLIGFVLGLAASAGERGPIELDYHVIPSFFIGVFGIVVAARLTITGDRPRAVVDAAPATPAARTAASFLACAVPGVAGLVLVLVHRAFVIADPMPDWLYGTYGAFDRLSITMIVPVIACVGGPVLGVAVARWLRFPGAELLTVVLVILWSDLSGYRTQRGLDPSGWLAHILHMASPYTAFGEGNGDGERPVTMVRSYTGSPTAYALWTIALCGLAVAATLWRCSTGTARKRSARAVVIIGVVAIGALVLASITGNQDVFITVKPHG
jgi:hypothetical protein